ncbi:hypothetical protein BABINDRAFT_42681 [Babjeviella inositovora NRRL Y-12698]|uniref:Uncharacterized protein n=1 Tax=Babjeviella inositovora NRRL Y-12698 TaxID=984486 RepID=A0A1E3QGQ1_9ASCO|nr:uncharacterized protein BABINDRAFT_42681 [Babjeviella inositovora NRRL Y-12698]ODQ76876.1 hypothetical protein BABINDRAFT_42681 [Babjeviella inositovora NRRL Y-12698]
MIIIFKHKNTELNDNYDETYFEIIEYENEIDIKIYLVENAQDFYMIWTKNKTMRLQLAEFNFNKHTIMQEKDTQSYLISLSTKAGDIVDRILHHMNNYKHNKCEI